MAAALTDPATDPLARMQGIDLPPAIPAWPPAPGWWVLGAALLGLTALLWWRQRRRHALRRAALAELDAIAAAHPAGDDRPLVQALSRLLRRLALARHPRARVAGLQGEAWLAFLDACLGGDGFRRGPGRALASLPYGAPGDLDREALLALVRRWIERCT